MSFEPYNKVVRACFAKPDHAGDLQQGYAETYITEIAESENGARLSLAVGVQQEKIAEMRFRAWACPYLIAAAETLCADKENRPIGELLEFDQNEIMRRLSVPDEKISRILLLEDALLLFERQLGRQRQENDTQD